MVEMELSISKLLTHFLTLNRRGTVRYMRESTGERTWILPNEPRPIRLMNTIWAERNRIHDDLTTVGDLTEWLTAVGFTTSASKVSDLAKFRSLRDALRRLAAFVTDDQRKLASAAVEIDEAIRFVNDASAQHPVLPNIEFVGRQLVRRDIANSRGTDFALSEVARETVALLTGEEQHLLRACNGPGCTLFFMRDHPRRNWCGDACGNRARAARHYQKTTLKHP